MTNTKHLLLAIALVFNTIAFAQLKTPAPSPNATIEQMVGLTQVKIEYSRPGKKDREIFGKLVPYGEMWRTGANASTKIEFDNDIVIGGKEIPAGKYALYTIPGELEWTIIIHKNLDNWGVGEYKEADDAVRFKVKPTKLNDVVETLTIDFSHLTSDGAYLNISWANTLVAIVLDSKSGEKVEKQIKELLIEGPSAGTYYGAARYYLDNDQDLKQALTWINVAIEKRPEAFWYIHQKANIQAKLGLTKEAIVTANKSIELAKVGEDGDYGYIAKNEELIKKLSEKK